MFSHKHTEAGVSPIITSFWFPPRAHSLEPAEQMNQFKITCTYGHDLMERVEKITCSKVNGDLGTRTTTVVTAGGTQVSATAYTYDEAKRLSSVSTALTNLTPSTFLYEYDLMDRLINIL